MSYSDKTILWGKARTALYFTLVVVLSVGFFGGIGFQFSSTQFGIETTAGMRWLQFSTSIGLFLMPPLLFASWVSNAPATFLGLRPLPTFFHPEFQRKNTAPLPPKFHTYLALVLIALGSIFAVDAIARLNYAILPDMPWVDTIKAQENQMQALIQRFLSHMDIKTLLANALIMVLIPAFGEEFFFRGVVQKLLQRNFNFKTAIFITAIFFAVVHQQPLSALPIFFMGMVLGYAKVWTGSLWAPILLHLINNGYALATAYIDPKTFANAIDLPYDFTGLFGILPLLIGLWWLRSIHQANTAWISE